MVPVLVLNGLIVAIVVVLLIRSYRLPADERGGRRSVALWWWLGLSLLGGVWNVLVAVLRYRPRAPDEPINLPGRVSDLGPTPGEYLAVFYPGNQMLPWILAVALIGLLVACGVRLVRMSRKR